MLLLIFGTLVPILLTVGAVFGLYYTKKKYLWTATNKTKFNAMSEEKKKAELSAMKKSAKKTASLGLLGLLLSSTCLFGKFVSVPANSVGIIYNEIKGGVQDETYGEGVHVKSIFEHVTVISTANRRGAVTTFAQTNDGQYAEFSISFLYKIESQNAGKFFRVSNASDIRQGDLETIIKEALQKETIKYNIFKLLSTDLEDARLAFNEGFKASLAERYFATVVSVSFDDIDGGLEVESILQELAKSEQQIEVAKKKAEAAIEEAKGNAEAKQILADAEAYTISKIGSANAEATTAYIEKVTALIDELYDEMAGTMTYETCTDLILGIVFYEEWNGELPSVLTSDSLSALIGSLIK